MTRSIPHPTHPTSLTFRALAVAALAAFAVDGSAPPPLSAQTVDPALFQSMEYRNIGPHRGGRVTTVAGIPDQPYTFFQGATGGGVW